MKQGTLIMKRFPLLSNSFFPSTKSSKTTIHECETEWVCQLFSGHRNIIVKQFEHNTSLFVLPDGNLEEATLRVNFSLLNELPSRIEVSVCHYETPQDGVS